MGIRRQLFFLQTATLGIVTTGAIGGWAVSLWIGHGPSRQAERLSVERDHLAHLSFDLHGAIPHTAPYLLSTPEALLDQVAHDIAGLRRFRSRLDKHLANLVLAEADPQVHRELETIRLLSVQVEQSLITVEEEVRQARRQGGVADGSVVQAAVLNPAIGLIRRHGDRLSSIHHRVDDSHARMMADQQRAMQLGVISWISLLLAAWVVGLLLTWRTGERMLQPLEQLERLMRVPPRQVEDALHNPVFASAPTEIASLSHSFQVLVHEQKRLLAQLEEQLRTDGLTAIGNRRHFDAMIDREWRRGIRSGEPLSLLLLDVDHFKRFNDHHGHVEGDRCLRQVAQTVSGQSRRNSDVVCRIGGEEFAVLLPATGPAEAQTVARKIVEAIDALAIAHGNSPVADWVTVSIGVACCTPSRNLTPHNLLEQADGALYIRKKHQGRHGICLAEQPCTPQDGEGGPGDTEVLNS